MSIPRSELIEGMTFQAAACKAMKSPLNACLLEVLADDARAGGAWLADLDGIEGDPVEGAVAVRLIGAFHRYVLDHEESSLARFYPSAGGRFDVESDREAFTRCVQDLLLEHETFFPGFIAHVPQTNEVARASGLAAGFLEISSRLGLPLSLLEIGASAGLNQIFDRYSHRFESEEGRVAWGPGDSPVQLQAKWTGAFPSVDTEMHVVERSSCDVAPLDIRDESVRRRLEAYVWGDQLERLERLRGAMALGLENDVRPDAAGAGSWLATQLPGRADGQATVIFHSVMWQYMPRAEQEEVTRLIEEEGGRAPAKKPLCWLRLEPPSPRELPEIRLRFWPGGEERVIGHAHPHGHVYQWRGWRA